MFHKVSSVRRYSRKPILGWFVLCAMAIGYAAMTLLPTSRVVAATSQTINFQARLMSSSGAIAPDGDYNVEFKFYDTESTGGTAQGACSGNCKWVETRTSGDKVHIANGYLTVNLGSVDPFGSTINWDQDLWITMNIGGTGSPSWDGEMSPRLKLTAVPYAFKAGQLAKLTGVNTSMLDFDTQTDARSILLPDESGILCIQSASTCGFVLGSGTAFVQGGNSLTAAGDLGTNDNFDLNLRTGGMTRLTIESDGSQITFASNVDIVLQGTTSYITNAQGSLGSESFGSSADVTGINALAVGAGSSAATGSLALGFDSIANGTDAIAIGAGTRAGHTNGIAIGIDAQTTANNQLVLSGISEAYLGNGVASASPQSIVVNATGGSGSNVAGASLTLAGGTSTGSANGGSIVLQTSGSGGGGTGINSLTTRATFDTNNYLYLGNGLTAASPNSFTISGTGSSTTAVAGGAMTLQGGNAAVGNANGGSVTLTGGSGFGSGVRGLVVVNTPTFATAITQNCGSDCNITQSNIDSNGAVIINATVASLTITLPDPTITTAGRIVYVTAANGSSDFTLSVNGGGVGNTISMKANTTATMIWNGSDWTAAGASSSTDLQAAYNNTASTAGAAELVLKNTATSNGLTVRNGTGTDEITGGLLEVQNSIGSNLFSVNNNAVEYANNGGAESSTFTMWTAAPTGGAAARYTTAGSYIATGQASVFADTTSTANTGIKNTLTASLTQNLKYKVSYAVRMSSTTSFTTLDTIFSSDGSATTATCASGSIVNFNVWARIDCTFTATTVGALNAIIIRHSDGVEHDFYIDNLSVTVSADASHAADGSADTGANIGGGTLNWAAVSGSTVTQTTSVLYDSSGAVSVATAATSGRGVYNKLSNNIAPSTDTQYRVAFYARGDGTNTATLGVSYTPDNGTNTISCGDYNRQTVSASTYELVSCYFTSGATTVTNAQVRIIQSSGSATTFYVDALTVTLNSNTSSNVQIGGANKGGPTTLFTLDRSSGSPIASNNDAYLGSMYYDTISGRIQCYEADGWGACGAAPDNIVNLNPEYAGAVLNGGGIGTMTADFCGNGGGLSVNTSLCTSGEAKNFYKWTSPQATQQTYSIYVSYQLPATFNGFSSDDTVKLTARVDNTTNASVTYEMYKSVGGTLTQCGTSETNVITGGGGSANTWYTYGINGNESTGCSFSSSAASGFVIFKINLKANSNANAYVSTLSFTTTGR